MNVAITTFLISMVPVIELRGALPFGVLNGLNIWEAYGLAVVGNLVPIPILIVFTRKVFEWLRTKSEMLNRMVVKLENKAAEKKGLVERFEFLGLMILVAIPLPGTGAWTGALVAAMMDMRLKRAMPAIITGVVVAGIIVSILTVGIDAMI